MTAAARLVAVVIGVVGIVLAAAALVREAVLASGWSIRWPLPAWWREFIAGSSWGLWLAATGSAVLAIALMVYAIRQLRRTRPSAAAVEFPGEGGAARLDVGALQRGLRRRLETGLPGLRARSLQLERTAEGWYVRLEADVPARDLVGLQARAAAVVAQDLERMGAMRLVRLDVVAHDLLRTAAPG